jgi:Tfp pilus assembly protein PilN
MHRINLIPESRRLARQRRVRVRYWVGIGLGYSAVVVAVCLWQGGLGTGADVRAQAEELAQLDAELAQIQASQSALQPQLAEQALVLAAGRSITDQPDWALLLTYLADEVLGDQIVLNGCSLGPAQGAQRAGGPDDTPLVLTLTGYAKTTPDVSRFTLRLEQTGLFDRVSLTHTNREPYLDGQAIAFEVRCLMNPGGGVTP